jgi:hypothetical protein
MSKIVKEHGEKFLEILSNLWGTDIAYQESDHNIKLILKAMAKAYKMGLKSKDYSEEDIAIFDKFVSICEREAMWDKVGRTYYNAKNRLKNHE